MKFILKPGKSEKDIENLRQEIEVSYGVMKPPLFHVQYGDLTLTVAAAPDPPPIEA